MKHLPLKLGIFVLVLFALVIATCLLWKPLKIRWYGDMVRSSDINECIHAINSLIGIGPEGEKWLVAHFPDGPEAAQLLLYCWSDIKRNITLKTAEKYFSSKSEGKAITEVLRCKVLHIAAKKNYVLLVKILIARKAPLNSVAVLVWKDNEVPENYYHHGTALHLATIYNNVDVVGCLLKAGAYVEGGDHYIPPLYYASSFGNIEVVKMLLDHGADVNAGWKIKDWETPTDGARTEQIKSLLRSHGGKTREELENKPGVKSQGSSVKEKKK